MSLPPGFDPNTTPLIPNPSGGGSNFIDPPSQASAYIAVGLVFCILSACFVLARLAVNLKQSHKLGVDDYLCLTAQILMTGFFVLSWTFQDTARHGWDIPLSAFDVPYLKRIFALNFISGPAQWSARASILALYVKVFHPARWLRITSYILLTIITLVYWTSPIVSGIFCAPGPGQTWETQGTRCTNSAILGPIFGAVGLATDLIILFLPLPIILKLNVNRRKKVGLLLAFTAGIFAVIAGIVSLYYRVVNFLIVDQFWNSGTVYALTFVECYTTIMVSCTPAISSLWINYISKSAFYTSLRSILLPKSTRSGSVKDSSKPRSKPRDAPRGTPLLGKHANEEYLELNDSVYSKPRTTVESARIEAATPGRHITKSTTIDQSWSQRRA